MGTILPLAQNAKLVTPSGNFTSQFKIYLDALLNRVGGVSGGSYESLTDSAGVIIWDLDANPNAVVVLQNGANILAAPLNMVAGHDPYKLTVIQPASGAAGTITWPKPPFLFPGGVTPPLTAVNNAVDEVWFSCDGTNLKLCVEALNFS